VHRAGPDALTAHAQALWDKGQRDAAVAAARAALLVEPGGASGYLNLAQIESRLGRQTAAITGATRAARLAPRDPAAVFSWARALALSGHLSEAVEALRLVIKLQPANLAAQVDLANYAYQLGDLPTAFAAMEHRFDVPGYPVRRRHADRPHWGGQQLTSRTILVHAERDFGDTIQYARFLPDAARRGGRVLLECQPELVRLFERVPYVSAVRAMGDALPPFDVQVPLNSLPFLVGATLARLPTLPYVDAPRAPTLPPPRSERLLKVGLVWASRADSVTAGSRGLPIGALAPLFAVDGVAWYSLQFGAEGALERTAGAVIDLAPEITDFADTAAYMGALDLVVTVDTAAAHLAGALGRPVWVLLPAPAAYRWMLGREDSPWYPTMRLLRQRTSGDWSHPIAQVVERLTAWVRARA
jgi:hypothetical protein